MLTIRLTRRGKKNQPFFKIVVIDKRRSSTGGRAVDILGFVDPLKKRKSIDKDKVLYWIKNGAQPSDTMRNLLISEKIIEGKKINLYKKSKKQVQTPKEEISN
jgi:small subunit ribosomal protein S16